MKATSKQHHAACLAWHKNGKRLSGLSARNQRIIRAIDSGTLHITDAPKSLPRLNQHLSRWF